MQTKQAKVTDVGSDEQTIRKLVDSWLIASEKGDLATLLNLVMKPTVGHGSS